MQKCSFLREFNCHALAKDHSLHNRSSTDDKIQIGYLINKLNYVKLKKLEVDFCNSLICMYSTFLETKKKLLVENCPLLMNVFRLGLQSKNSSMKINFSSTYKCCLDLFCLIFKSMPYLNCKTCQKWRCLCFISSKNTR